jgi:hypothetical protein
MVCLDTKRVGLGFNLLHTLSFLRLLVCGIWDFLASWSLLYTMKAVTGCQLISLPMSVATGYVMSLIFMIEVNVCSE